MIPAVFFVSLSSLAFEVILTRIFALTQWHHLTFMVISLAMFGFAASGAFLSLTEARKPGVSVLLATDAGWGCLVFAYAVIAVAAFIILNRLPLDYFRLPLEPIQSLYLFIAYLTLSLPFFATGLLISLAYTARPDQTGLIYFANMSGSGIGAVAPALLLPYADEGRLILLAALSPLLLIPFLVRKTGKALRYSLTGAVLILSIPAALLLFPKPHPIIQVIPSPYKSLSQVLKFPHTKILRTRTGLRGRIDLAESPYYRFAPGLSLKFSREVKGRRVAFTDGDHPFALYDPPFDFPRFSLPYAGYAVSDRPDSVLVIAHGGGAAIPCALASRPREVNVAVSHPALAEIVSDHYRIPTVAESSRTWLAGSDRRFSVIHLENWGPSLPGVAALGQDHDFTLEAFDAYLNHLTPGGVLILSRRLILPPSDSVRLFGTAWLALKNRGVSGPGQHLIMLRNWEAYTLLVSNRPFSRLETVRSFARELNFDPVWLPGMKAEEANRFNIFDRPFHYQEIRRLAAAFTSASETDFYRNADLYLSPQTDDRPFPSRFLKWARAGSIYRQTGERFYTLMMSGEVVVGAVFVTALAVSLGLLILPLTLAGRRERPSWRLMVYFLGVGAGFMLAELWLIKVFTLILGDPHMAFTAVLFGIMVFSGTGGYFSRYLDGRSVGLSVGGLAALLVIFGIAMKGLIPWGLGLSGPQRFLLALGILTPAGFFMGLPFSLGLRWLPASQLERAHAWAANGCASVLAAVAAAQISMGWGISRMLWAAVLCYLFSSIVCVIHPDEPCRD